MIATDKAGNTATVTVCMYSAATVTLPTGIGYTVTTANGTTVPYGDTLTFTVTIGAGYSKTDDFTVRVNGEVVTPDDTNSYAVQNVSEDITITVDGVADTTAPSLKVTVGSYSWRTLANRIFFSQFFKETVTISLQALDDGSGVREIRYYISHADTALTVAELEALSPAKWQIYSSEIGLLPCGKAVIYVKAIDNSGNITYASSDGIVFDTELPVIGGIEDGSDYDGEITFTVTDSNLQSVTVDGVPVTPTNGKYTLPADNGTHTVIATDKAGNTVTVTARAYVTVTVTFVADGVVVDTKTVRCNSDVTDIPAIPAKEGYTDTAPYWDVSDLSAVTADMTVTAVYTKNAQTAPETNSDTADAPDQNEPGKAAVIAVCVTVAVGGVAAGSISLGLFLRKRRRKF